MGLTRQQIAEIILAEREYQDQNFNPDDVLDSGLTRGESQKDVTRYLVMLKSYLDKCFDDWTWDYKRDKDLVNVLQELTKMGAIIVSALENIPAAEELLERGLRDE